MAYTTPAKTSYEKHCNFFKKPLYIEENASPILTRIYNQFGQLDCFKPIQDQYDYLDEVFAVTLVPVVCTAYFAFLFSRAMYLAAYGLYVGIFEKNINSLLNIESCVFQQVTESLAYLATGLYCALKGLVNLVTRPLATMYAKPELVTNPIASACESVKTYAQDTFDNAKKGAASATMVTIQTAYSMTF